ncbi:MAG: Zn-ribbon domain-containing OB-fold protein [Actinomycetota bacterium]
MSFVADFEFEQPYAHSTGPSLSRFFTALRDEQRILARACARCGLVSVPPRDHCETCGGKAGEWSEVGPGGIVQGFTIQGEFAFARIKLDGADVDLIHHASREGLQRGVRVLPQWAPIRTGTILDIECFAFDPIAADSHAEDSDPVDVLRVHPRIPYKLSAGSLISRFMTEIAAGKIFGNKCPSCASVFVPPRSFCSKCWIACEDWIEVSDQGSVVSFVIVNVPFYGQQVEIPYVLASVLLDGASSPFLHIVSGSSCKIGLRVKAHWRSHRTGFINEDIDHFEPI